MRLRRPGVRMFLSLLSALLIHPASAQEDDLDDLELDDEPAPAPAPAPDESDPPPTEGDELEDDELDEFRDLDEGEDLLSEEAVNPDSGDSEAIFREAQTRLSAREQDEELSGWEEYLGRYPNSPYRRRIESRMEELTDQLYGNGPQPDEAQPVDALRAEIPFAQAMQLESLNPRGRVQLGFEWGLPDYVNLIGDVEYPLARTFSIHGGIHRRYSGWNIEAGARWALVKSTRTDTLVTLIGDLRMNTNPAYPSLRPQLAIGKRFGRVDAQLQGGVDIEYRSWASSDGLTTENGFQPSIVGGANVYYAASDRVGVFVETHNYMKTLPEDGAFEGGMFRFNVVSFGLKFFPGASNKRNQEMNFGATVPYTQQWWQFHYGSVMGQFNYYPDWSRG